MELNEDNILDEIRRALSSSPKMDCDRALVLNNFTYIHLIKAINKTFVGLPSDIIVSDISSLWGLDIVKAVIDDDSFAIMRKSDIV